MNIFSANNLYVLVVYLLLCFFSYRKLQTKCFSVALQIDVLSLNQIEIQIYSNIINSFMLQFVALTGKTKRKRQPNTQTKQKRCGSCLNDADKKANNLV